MSKKSFIVVLLLMCIMLLMGCETTKNLPTEEKTVTAEQQTEIESEEKTDVKLGEALPSETAKPIASQTVKEEKPTETAKATATAKPTQAPKATEKPKATKEAKATEKPKTTNKPKATKEAKATEKPKATEKTGHWEKVWVVDFEAWDENLYEGRDITYCTACGADITNNIDEHIFQHADRGESAGWTIKWVDTLVGVKHHPEEGHYEDVWVAD